MRASRRYHRYFGLGLGALLLVSALTGALLGWKKQSAWLQPPTQRGTEGTLGEWRSLEDLRAVAVLAFRQNAPRDAPTEVSRMDVRPGRNTVKVRFAYGDYEVQVDGITAEVLSVGRRNADWIERIHDGSIVSEGFKLASMNALGVGLAALTATGAWLYWGPRRMRARRRRR